MFKNFKRNPTESQQLSDIQFQQEQFDTILEEHRAQFDKEMESMKKAGALMRETMNFIMDLCITQQPTQYEQAKSKLRSHLLAVQEDETLKHNAEVQRLVSDIDRNMDDKDAMVNMIPRLGTLVCTPQAPDILIDFNLKF